jgi:uroporphyrinogen-III synthase
MAKQSSAPAVLLTRPPGQGARFAARLAARFGPLRIVESPLMAPEFLPAALPPGRWGGVIFTSETGVEAAGALALGPLPAYCVGPHTAAAAAAAGYAAGEMGGDADGLVAALLRLRPTGPLLHLHGEDTRGAVAARLTAGGLPTTGLAVYAQRARPLAAAARGLLAGAAPVVVPLFSPRTAALFSLAAAEARAPLWVAALSPAVAAAVTLPTARMVVAARPEAGAMLDAVAPLLPPHRGA